MTRLLLLAMAAALLAGCKTSSTMRITSAPATVQTAGRSEPIFYNGKTYRLDYSAADETGMFDMAVSGMGAAQRNDAVQLATSSLGYFACPDGQKGRLLNEPSYAGAKWHLQARCG
jgi:hypothetical protein